MIVHDPYYPYPMAIILNRLRPSAQVPTYGTTRAACFDISAAFEPGLEIATFDVNNAKFNVPVTPELEYILLPKERALIPTGWVFGIPPGHSLRIHPRSGIAWKNGVTLANAEAVIDEDYTHETFVMVINTTTERFTITNGMRIAQGELVQKINHEFVEIDTKIEVASNRTGGLGSTGV